MRRRIPELAAALALSASILATSAGAQSVFDPFGEPETSRPPPKKSPPPPADERPFLQPMPGGNPAPSTSGRPSGQSAGGWGANSPPGSPALPIGPIDREGTAVERGDLEPVLVEPLPQAAGSAAAASADDASLPSDMWRGLTVSAVEALIANAGIPPRSPVLHDVWRRLVVPGAGPEAASPGNVRFTAIRAEALDRSGLVDEAAWVLAQDPATARDPILATLSARIEIGRNNGRAACNSAETARTPAPGMPKSLILTSILANGYCAAARGDMTAASLQAALAREHGQDAEASADLLDAVASGATAVVPKGAILSLVDYRILELGHQEAGAVTIENAEPNLLGALARNAKADPLLRLAAAERAAMHNAIAPAELASLYLALAGPIADGVDANANASKGESPLRRAALYKAAVSERTPLPRSRHLRSFLDSARRAGFYWPALFIAAKPASEIEPIPETGWFAETAIETALASGDTVLARTWCQLGDRLAAQGNAAGFGHWLALADLSDANLTAGRSEYLDSIERLARDGRLDPVLLHKLVTVLDALEIKVPIPLWEAAGRSPQPAGGYLPDTGILTALQAAAAKQEIGHTVLLAIRTLGPDGASGANLIALGDTIRALRKAGLETEARRLALEALFPSWPRNTNT